MARIAFSPLVSSIRGSIGPLTFTNPRSGPQVRSKPTPNRTPTTARLAARAAYQHVSNNWRALTDAQRQTWLAQAEVRPIPSPNGPPRLLTARQLYFRENLNPEWRNPIHDDIAPWAGIKQPPLDLNIDAESGGSIVVSWTTPPDSVAVRGLVYCVRTFRPRPYYFVPQWTYMVDVGTLNTATITTNFENALGEPAVGEWIGVRVVLYRQDKFHSIPVTAFSAAVAP